MGKRSFIALYGINRTGKSKQRELLVSRLEKQQGVLSLKFPVYDLKPSGPILDGYLRKGNPHQLSSREFQILQVINRTQMVPKITEALSYGKAVVAEDYIGTGLAWGMAAGVDRAFLMSLNEHLPRPDISILLNGEQFNSGKEEGHLHEGDDELTQKAKQAHLTLAKIFRWHEISSHGKPEEVHERIWSAVSEYCF